MVRFFVLVINSPIHETLIRTKVSLLNNVKFFLICAKITLTSVSLSFITQLPLNKQKSSIVVFSKVSLIYPLYVIGYPNNLTNTSMDRIREEGLERENIGDF